MIDFEAEAEKLLEALDELETHEEKKALLISYGILCGLKPDNN